MEGVNSDIIEVEVATTLDSSSLSNAVIKERILNGTFKLINKRGRSKVWDSFSGIADENNVEVENMLACKTCKNIYKFNRKSTSNLVKHKCYIMEQVQRETPSVRVDVSQEDKKECITMATKWILENCRPFAIIEDSGLKRFAEFLITMGAKHGKFVDVEKLFPHRTTLSRNVDRIYQFYFYKIKEDIQQIKSAGFAITCDLWTDNYLRQTYFAATIHYIKNGHLFNRLLGLKSMETKPSTAVNIKAKLTDLLEEFDLDLSERSIIVTDRGSNMVAAFNTDRHIYCINHLINNCVQKAIEDQADVESLCLNCCKLVKYFKKAGINSALTTTLKSFCTTRWNSMYYMLHSIKCSWGEINQLLAEKNEMSRLNFIYLNQITALVDLLKNFEEASKQLEGESYPTIHLAFAHIYGLKKTCIALPDDTEIIKNLKGNLNSALESIALRNMSIFHKIALYLYPPANALLQFSDIKKNLVRSECKRLSMHFTDENTAAISNNSSVTPHSAGVLYDFIKPTTSHDPENRIDYEMVTYESIDVSYHESFDVLQWWQLHKTQYPQLYKLSTFVLATPASSAPSERVFSRARNIITDKRSTIGNNATTVNQIMFMHYNVPDTEIMHTLQS